MTHFELRDFGFRLGLDVETIRYWDGPRKADVLELHFRLDMGRCDYIAGFKMDYNMDEREYEDACAQTLNTLRQFETWS